MAKINVHNEEPFTVPARTFTISASASGYSLKFTAQITSDGDADTTTWTAIGSAVTANENCEVVNANPANHYKLSGNTADVVVVY